ncbi:hypothetical protein L3V83_15145 [Thiotrichales bacterium 19X7-9]|nr:hypothetical protein [Thiotrichales bacterium 19X7-9]
MEITLDIGTNIWQKIQESCNSDKKGQLNFAIDMIELGLKVHEASTKKADEKVEDPIVKMVLENNYLAKEILNCVFERSKTTGNFFDAKTLIHMIESNSDAYIEGTQNA